MTETILMNFYKIAGISGVVTAFLFIFYKLFEKLVTDMSISLKKNLEHMIHQIEEDSRKQHEQLKRDSENNQRNLENIIRIQEENFKRSHELFKDQLETLYCLVSSNERIETKIDSNNFCPVIRKNRENSI